jgi:hypothetical protein
MAEGANPRPALTWPIPSGRAGGASGEPLRELLGIANRPTVDHQPDLVVLAVSGRTQGVGAGAEPPPGGVRIDITVEAIEGSNDRLTIGVDLEPDAALVSKTGLTLARQVTVVLDPSAGSRAVVFPAGQIPAVDRIDLILDGDIRNWPLDRYHVALVVFASAGSSPDSEVLPSVVRIGRSLPGWHTTVDAEADDLRLSGVQQFDITVRRSGDILAFAALLLAVLVALPTTALLVSGRTFWGHRRFSRRSCRGWRPCSSPPSRYETSCPATHPGSWDAVIVLWVIIGLVGALGLYVAAWWREGRRAPV